MAAAMNMASNPQNLITLDAKEIDGRSVGRIVMWQLSGGGVSLESLENALKEVESSANPPSPVTPKLALHRAVETVATELGFETLLLGAKEVEKDANGKPKGYQRKRGDWAIVKRPKERMTDMGGAEVVYSIVASARVGAGDQLEATVSDVREDDDLERKLKAAYAASKGVLVPADIGNWLCDKLRGLDAMALKPNGGIYFIPKPNVARWDKVVAALAKVSAHKIHGIPAMRTQDAIDAIMSAITEETRAECERVNKEIAESGLGKRALESREKEADDLLSRLERYETLLGGRLDDLRSAIDETRAAIVTAQMTLAAPAAEGT